MNELLKSSKLDNLPYEERKQYCYCKPGQTHCGKCMVCGKPGHIRSLMFVTFPWCDDCYEKESLKEMFD